MAINAWSDFKERTAIHGFAEYGGMKGWVTKGIWILFAVAVAGFCGKQLAVLVISYAEHEPTTNVEVKTGVPMAPIALRFDSEVRRYIDLLDLSGDEEKIGIAATGLATQGTCPQMFYMEKLGGKYENIMSNNLSQRAQIYHGSAVMESFLKKFRSKIPSANLYLVSNTTDRVNDQSVIVTDHGFFRLFRNGVERFKDPGGVEYWYKMERILASYGPTYKFVLDDFTTLDFDRIEIGLEDKISQNPPIKFTILAGAEAERMGPVRGVQFYFGNSLELSIKLSVYRFSPRFCNDGIFGLHRLSCETSCFLEQAKQYSNFAETTYCIPFMGDAPEAKGLRMCIVNHEDYTLCEESTAKCHERCAKCKSCRPCGYVEGSILVDRILPLNDTRKGQISIRVISPDHIQSVEMREIYTWVTLISQVGGILGLCFGISILSTAHFFYALFMMAKEAVSGHGKKQSLAG